MEKVWKNLKETTIRIKEMESRIKKIMESSIVAASALLAWKVTQRARLLTKADKRGACAAWIGYFDNDINFQHCDVRRLRV